MLRDDNIEVLNHECVACHARARQATGEDNAIVILYVLLYEGCTPEDLLHDLCFEHRRQLKSLTKESP